MEGIELSKVKYIHSGNRRRHPLNIDQILIIKDRTVKLVQCVWRGTCGRRRVNGGDEGEGMWWMVFIYLYEIKQ
jgi:hypothetical protein